MSFVESLRRRRLAAFTLGFSLGALAAYYWIASYWLLIPGGICLVLALRMWAWTRKGKGIPLAHIIFLGIALACIWRMTYDGLFRAAPVHLHDETFTLEVRLADYPYETRTGMAARVTARLPGVWLRQPGILYGLDDNPDYLPGITLRLDVRLRAVFTDDLTIDPFVYSRYGAGVYYNLTARSPIEIIDTLTPWLAYPARWRKAAADRLTALYGDGGAGGMVAALLLGQRGMLSVADNESLSRSGVGHMAAVSGMHIGFLAGFMLVILGNKRRTFWITAPILLVYVAVVGFPPSAVRAVIMALIMLGGRTLRRETDTVTSLCAALLCLLVQNPYIIGSLSVQYSFSATFGIILFASKIQEAIMARVTIRNKYGYTALRYTVAGLSVTLSAQLFTIPLTALYSNQMVFVSVPANLAVQLLAQLAFLGGIIATALSVVWFPLGAVFAAAAAIPAGAFLAIARWFARLPIATLELQNSFYMVWFIVTYASIWVAILWPGTRLRHGRRYAAAGTLSLTLLAAALWLSWGIPSGGLELHVLDVGQGQTLLLRSGNANAMVDCGGPSARGTLSTALSRLSALDITYLDLLVITHHHADHSNAVPALLEFIEVGLIVMPEEPETPLFHEVWDAAGAHNVPVLLLEQDISFRFGESRLYLFAPRPGRSGNENGIAVLCLWSFYGTAITGDLGFASERNLLARYDWPTVESIVVGHHGSRHSTSAEWLATLQPRYGFISVGHNSYGHPAPDLMARLEAANVEVYRTDQHGLIIYHAGRGVATWRTPAD
jgi:competence protein ComEC